ncbi:hypothetical protein Tco_0463318, partial [Tanacetum coccineum]
ERKKSRIFKDEMSTWSIVLEKIVESIKLKLMGLKVKRSMAIKDFVDWIWEVNFPSFHA